MSGMEDSLRWITNYGVAYIAIAIGAVFITGYLAWWFSHHRWYTKEKCKREFLAMDRDLALRETLTETTQKNSLAQIRAADAMEEIASCTTELKASNSVTAAHLALHRGVFELGADIADALLENHPKKPEIKPKLEKLRSQIEAARPKIS